MPAEHWDIVSFAAADVQAMAARRAAAAAIASALSSLAETSNVGAFVFRDEAMRAASIVVEIAAELSSSCVLLLEAGKVYAAASLLRQLVEAEYLICLFSSDKEGAERWSKSAPADIRKMFAPKVLRERAAGAFRDTEYWAHGDLGGHPNPKATLLLSGHRLTIGDVEYPRIELQWADLCQHLVRIWSGVLKTFREYQDWTRATAAVVESRVEDWRARDKLTSEILFWPVGE